MGRGAEIFQLLAGEDIDGDQMDFGVTMLASLGGTHLDNLAGAILDDYMTVFAQSGTLHRVGGRGAGIGRLESVLMLQDTSAYIPYRHRGHEWNCCHFVDANDAGSYLRVVGHGAVEKGCAERIKLDYTQVKDEDVEEREGKLFVGCR